MLENIPYQEEALKIVQFLETWAFDNLLVMANATQLLLLITVYFVTHLLQGRLIAALDRISLPQSIKRFEAPAKEILEPLAPPVFMIIVLWFSVFALRGLGEGVHIINLVVSLLSAWVVIRFASAFISDPGWSRFVSVSVWTIAALNIVGLLEVTTAFLDSVAFSFGEMRFSMLGLIKGAIALAILFWGFSLLEKALRKRIDSLQNITPSAKVLLNKFLRIVLIILAVLIAMDAVGIDLTALAVFSGAIGIGLGFGLQKVAANLVSGVILLLDRSVKPGDVIALGDTYGRIDKLGGRYVSVITRDGTEHLIPNEELITQRVENWSFSDTNVRQRAMIGVDYDSDIRLAMKLCEEAASELDRIVKDPAPKCLLRNFGDSSVDIELRFWVNDAENGLGNIRSDVLLKIWDKFNENGVEFTYPQRDLNIREPIKVKLEAEN